MTANDDTAAVEERVGRLLRDHPPADTEPREFLGAQFDRGLAAVHFPEGSGGLGLPRTLQGRVSLLLQEAGAPSPFAANPIGVGMAAPTLVAHGTDSQCARHLRPLFVGDEIWCQLFSEPGAGSDVAGLATSARRDGDTWLVNGQKVWTSLGHLARWGLLLARTDPDVPKHRGLTYFVVDMAASEVEVRPLFQMTGYAEFNEVYLTDLPVPDSDRLGAVGNGWMVAVTTLMNERVAIGGGVSRRGEGVIKTLVDTYLRRGGTEVMRDRVMALWVRADVLRLTSLRAAAGLAGGTPGPEGSIGKLARTELMQDVHRCAVDLMGMEGGLYPTGYRMRRPERPGESAHPQQAFLRSRAFSIEGGTTEIMKNILAERVLGLPGDVRTDKEADWSEVPRS